VPSIYYYKSSKNTIQHLYCKLTETAMIIENKKTAAVLINTIAAAA
jgi:hypothetical protein